MPERSKEWKELLVEKLQDEKLIKKHGQLLDSNLLLKKEFNGNEYKVSEIQEIFKAAKITLVACKTIVHGSGKTIIHAWYLEPNDLTQREALKESYKLRGKYEPEAHKIDISNVSDEELDGKIQDLIEEITRSKEGKG